MLLDLVIKMILETDKITQWVRMRGSKPKDLSMIPKIHMGDPLIY